jgi:hypothetical protein
MLFHGYLQVDLFLLFLFEKHNCMINMITVLLHHKTLLGKPRLQPVQNKMPLVAAGVVPAVLQVPTTTTIMQCYCCSCTL